jgi:hypothetical protein
VIPVVLDRRRVEDRQLAACGLLPAAAVALLFVSIATGTDARGDTTLAPASLTRPAPAMQPAPTRSLESRDRLGCRARRSLPCG